MSSKSKKLRLLSLFWDYASALSLILFLVLLWNLGKGPIEVNFLRPYIIQALTNETSSYNINISSVNLELTNSIQPLKITAKNISITDTEKLYNITAPKLSLSFSARALLKGLLAPSSISVDSPKIEITTSYNTSKKDNTTTNIQDTPQEANLKKIEFYFQQFEDFLTRFNSSEKLYIESFINEIDIINADIKINEIETKQQLNLIGADISFLRALAEIKLSAVSAVQFQDRTSSIDTNLNYNLFSDKIIYSLNFTDLVLTDLYNILVPIKGDIKAVDIPISGNLKAQINFRDILNDKEHFAEKLGSNIEEVSFSIDGGDGKIGFLGNKDFDYKVSAFKLKGKLYGGLDKIDIKDTTFKFNDKQAMLSLSATGFKDYFLKGNLKDFKLKFGAKIGEFNMDELSLLWPKYIGQKAWKWCKDSLYGGKISNGDFIFSFGFDENTEEFSLLNLTGKADVKDANLHYLDGMPIVKNVYGTALFSNDKIEILVDKGVSDNVILTEGNVLLYDLNKDDNFIKINLKGNSSIPDALKFIDNEPLGFTKEIGISPDLVTGDVDIDLSLGFELKSNLKPNEIKVEVKGLLQQVEYLGLSDGKTFVSDKLDLFVSQNGFELNGIAKYQDIPVTIALNEDFHNKSHKSKIIANITIDDNILKKLGVNADILSAPYFTGSSNITATLTFLNNGKIELFVDGSLKDTDINYAFLGFDKNKGESCYAKAKMIINNNKIEDVPEFSLIKAQFSAKGNIKTNTDGYIKTIDITNIKSPKTFAKAKVDFTYTPKLKLKVTINGDSYDLTDFFDKKKSDTKANLKKKEKSLKDPLEDVMDTDIVIGVNKLWTNDNIPVTNFAGKLELRNGIGVHRINMIGNYGQSKDVKMKLDYEPRGNEYILNVDSNNAGSTLKVLRLYSHMKGGNLKIEAKRDRYKNFRGHAQMRDFSLSDTPIFAKLLSLSSLSGIVDMLTGEGLRFTHFNAPFSYTFSTKDLSTEDARVFGPVLGIKLIGTYNLFDDIIKASGLVIPAYTLNTFIGNIPVVGKILRGSDGSVFATNYNITGTTEKPVITINPLSTLAPNSIKELFSSGE